MSCRRKSLKTSKLLLPHSEFNLFSPSSNESAATIVLLVEVFSRLNRFRATRPPETHEILRGLIYQLYLDSGRQRTARYYPNLGEKPHKAIPFGRNGTNNAVWKK